jgi:uncharacterized protein (DUF433 family)
VLRVPANLSEAVSSSHVQGIHRPDEGNYYVAGTRISLDSIVHAFRRGESPETICQNFELLDLEQVYGAIAYYLAHKPEVDAYLIGQDQKWAEGQLKSESLVSRNSSALNALGADR